ncbi:uncharacterized protein C14orf93 homolog isoform X2 [Carettochelys insculpta]|uniref:uncharacterized protein C14orf93 homolog isoform X2 n=1 Tax=Carettochelys insculpta TaxID=44489 RepID=UPI003EC10340
MAFSATILFSPPSAPQPKCSCCACKREPGAEGGTGAPPPSCAPISVSGQGLAVQSSEQLLHLIYQRLDKAVGLAEAALVLARTNHQALQRLEEEVGALRRGAPPTAKASPAPLAPEEEEEDDEEEGLGSGVQVVIEELRQLGAAAAAEPPGRLCLSPPQPGDAGMAGALTELPTPEDPLERGAAPAFPTTPSASPSASGSEELPPCPAPEDSSPGEPRFSLGFASAPCRSRGSGPKNTRRKRDLVLSKLVHNIHNHVSNERRFNGSESIKSAWNIGVVKFLLEKLRHELVTSQNSYTDKELKALRQPGQRGAAAGPRGAGPVARRDGGAHVGRGGQPERAGGVGGAAPPLPRRPPHPALLPPGHQRQARRQGQPGLRAALRAAALRRGPAPAPPPLRAPLPGAPRPPALRRHQAGER